MRFVFQVAVEVEREEGKFASREDLGGQIIEELESVDPGELTGENEGTYSVTAWDVEEVER